MKKIILLGDSIRMGYDKYVKEALASSAEVYYPQENCKFAQYLYRFAHQWAQDGNWPHDIDLIHWNAGLWDLLELFSDGEMTDIGYYAHNIGRIQRRLKMLFPDAIQIFATSTAVQEDMFLNPARSMRHNSTIERYNEAAIGALEGTDVVINDLYGLTHNCPRSWHSDATHYYTDEATKAIGSQVLSEICVRLDIKAEDVDMKAFSRESYDKKNIGQ